MRCRQHPLVAPPTSWDIGPLVVLGCALSWLTLQWAWGGLIRALVPPWRPGR